MDFSEVYWEFCLVLELCVCVYVGIVGFFWGGWWLVVCLIEFCIL